MSSLSYAEQLRNDLFRAYEDARKNKRNTLAQLEFEKDAEHNLIELYHELLDGSYVPGKSICCSTISLQSSRKHLYMTVIPVEKRKEHCLV